MSLSIHYKPQCCSLAQGQLAAALSKRTAVACCTSLLPRLRPRVVAAQATAGKADAQVAAAKLEPSSETQAAPSPRDYVKQYLYNSEDGVKPKATIEHIFPKLTGAEVIIDQERQQSGSAASASSFPAAAPWAMSWQMSERNMVWNDDLKLRLVKRIASQEMGITEETLEARLLELTNLLPDLTDRLPRMAPKHLARLASSSGTVALRLVQLRDIFPKTNVSKLVGGRLGLLLDEDLGAVEAAASKLRTMLPGIDIDRFVEAFPIVLDIECFERAVDDARRLLPGLDLEACLRRTPETVLQLMKGRSLIPYDD